MKASSLQALVDDFGTLVYIARGLIISDAHNVMQHSPASLRRAGRPWGSEQTMVCMDCGLEWSTGEASPRRCFAKAESVSSGFGSVQQIADVRAGRFGTLWAA